MPQDVDRISVKKDIAIVNRIITRRQLVVRGMQQPSKGDKCLSSWSENLKEKTSERFRHKSVFNLNFMLNNRSGGEDV